MRAAGQRHGLNSWRLLSGIAELPPHTPWGGYAPSSKRTTLAWRQAARHTQQLTLLRDPLQDARLTIASLRCQVSTAAWLASRAALVSTPDRLPREQNSVTMQGGSRHMPKKLTTLVWRREASRLASCTQEEGSNEGGVRPNAVVGSNQVSRSALTAWPAGQQGSLPALRRRQRVQL